ncbi:MAG: hypothetical protein IMZ47_01905 [Firmicutes bacterium]|nr:hypothetical protein [Bacillota bacterium]
MNGIIGGLFLAWVLTWFNVDRIIIDGINELFALSISTAGYYVLFAIIGFISNVVSDRK